MHRIDGPGATVDNKFTDGDPIAGVQATVVTDEWLNDVQENIIGVLTGAGVTPSKGRANDLIDAIRKLSSGVIGSIRNAKMNVVVASVSGTFTADEIIVGSALGGQTYRLANFNKNINLSGTGAGGMDTGAAPASGFVSIYAIYNPTTQASALLACNQTTSNGQIYTGANMPAGYTASALVSAWGTTAAGLLAVGSQQDLTVDIALTTVINAAANTSPIGISISTIIPSAAKSVSGVLQVSSNTGTLSTVQVASTIALIGQRSCGVRNPGLSQSSFSDVKITTTSQLFFSCLTNGTDIAAFVGISSYKI